MIAITCYILGGCLIGGGVKGFIDRLPRERRIIEHTPASAGARRSEVKWLN